MSYFQHVEIVMDSPARLMDLLMNHNDGTLAIQSHREVKRLMQQGCVKLRKPIKQKMVITDIDFMVDRSMRICIGKRRTYDFCFDGFKFS